MKVNLHEPSFGEEEIMAASDQMRTTQVTMGKRVREFEDMCASRFGSEYALMCNSGSSANLLAISALCSPLSPYRRMKPGDEVIVPSLSWATSVWPIIQHGLVPVFVDCDLRTLNFDRQSLYDALSDKTAAIMAVHVYGNPCDVDMLRSICDLHGLHLIEDTCESMGAEFKGKCVGTVGDIGTMSLYFSHHITTLEGGLFCTNDCDLLESMRIHLSH